MDRDGRKTGRGKRRKLAAVLIGGVALGGSLLGVTPNAALAGGASSAHVVGDPGTGSSGPMQSAADQHISDLKMAIGAAVSRGQTPDPSQVQEVLQLTGAPRHAVLSTPPVGAMGTAAIQPNYQQGSWYYASVDGGVSNFSEPMSDPAVSHGDNWYEQLCGPGSATKLITDWDSNPENYNGSHYGGGLSRPQGYLLELAVNQGMMNDDGGYWGTYPGKEASVINNIVSAGWYHYGSDYNGEGGSILGQGNLTSELASDIQNLGTSMVAESYTNYFEGGWTLYGGHGLHLVEVNGYNPSSGQFYFYESASALSSSGSRTGPTIYGFKSQYISNLNGSDGRGIVDSVW